MFIRHLPTWLGTLLIFLAWLLIATVSYRHVNMALLRGEAGLYQAMAHNPVSSQSAWVHGLFSKATKGHYVPLAFWSELQFTKWAGMRGSIWKARQIGGAALLATSIFFLVRALGRTYRLRPATLVATATVISSIFVFQPHMTDIVAWPTMIGQLAWMILTVGAIFALVRFVHEPERMRWIWLTAGLSYASMHVMGLGLATGAAVAAVLLILWFGAVFKKLNGFSGARRNIEVALAILSLLSVTHALVMLFSTPMKAAPVSEAPFSILHGLGLLGIYPFIIAANLFVPFSMTKLSVQTLDSAWPFGLFVLVAAGFGIFALARAAFQRSDPLPLVRFVLITFSIVCFLTCVLLILVRQRHEPGFDAFASYLNGPRNLVVLSLSLLGPMAVLVLSFGKRRPAMATVLFVALAVTAFAARIQYERTTYAQVVPYAGISHGKAWRMVVAMAREARAQNLPIPNVPFYTLAWFSGQRLKDYEPLLRDALELNPEQPCDFISWAECRGSERALYDSRVPSLPKVMKLLELAPEKDSLGSRPSRPY